MLLRARVSMPVGETAMLRPFATITAAATLVANASTCSGHATRAEADVAGERVYEEADLIVEGTAGPKSDAYRDICFGRDGKPQPGDDGRTVSLDRPFVIHRVLKGRAPERAIMAYEPATASAFGCGILYRDFDEDPPEDLRHVMVLRQTADGRYRPVSSCARVALRNSRRGQVLFKRAG
ncbi:hypothetical protein ACFSC3_11405 [Sphingomonas floccifaciens]|uniref:Uncharacterized protein n=1 Tax=Sphingomonas floccifaciens TaxID=1844115 RepID=A0ABW4NH61_9SPHN